jgi:ParB family chromosome partitioning protein
MAQARANLVASAEASMTSRAEEPRAAASPTSQDRQAEGRRRMTEAAVIRIDRIIPDPGQPRKEFDPDDLARLGESIRERGQLQPIRVRWDDSADRYVVVVGERRWRAAAAAGLETLSVTVAPGAPTPEEILEDQLVENCLRVDLRPIEQANAYKRLIEGRGLTVRALADRLRVAPSAIAKAMKLLELPGPLRESVDRGELGREAAYELTKVDDPGEQAMLAREIVAGHMKPPEIRERTHMPRDKGRGGKPRPWTHERPGRVRVTATPLADDVSMEEIAEVCKEAAAAARKKRGRGAA